MYNIWVSYLWEKADPQLPDMLQNVFIFCVKSETIDLFSAIISV